MHHNNVFASFIVWQKCNCNYANAGRSQLKGGRGKSFQSSVRWNKQVEGRRAQLLVGLISGSQLWKNATQRTKVVPQLCTTKIELLPLGAENSETRSRSNDAPSFPFLFCLSQTEREREISSWILVARFMTFSELKQHRTTYLALLQGEFRVAKRLSIQCWFLFSRSGWQPCPIRGKKTDNTGWFCSRSKSKARKQDFLFILLSKQSMDESKVCFPLSLFPSPSMLGAFA